MVSVKVEGVRNAFRDILSAPYMCVIERDGPVQHGVVEDRARD